MIETVAVLLALAIGYAVGRADRPLRVIECERVVTVERVIEVPAPRRALQPATNITSLTSLT